MTRSSYAPPPHEYGDWRRSVPPSRGDLSVVRGSERVEDLTKRVEALERSKS